MTITNRDHRDCPEWAAAALRHFQNMTGSEHEYSLGDLLRDLMLFGHANNLDFEAALTRAREHCLKRKVGTTPYMATFNTPAGTATESFRANSPQEALELAQKFADDGSLTDMDIEPPAETYCVREITISDEHGEQHALWQTDEYRLQLAAPKLLQALEKQIEITREIIDAWNNTDQLYGAVEDLISELDSKSQWAQEIIKASEKCDLTAPIEELEKSLDDNLAAVAQAKGGAE